MVCGMGVIGVIGLGLVVRARNGIDRGVKKNTMTALLPLNQRILLLPRSGNWMVIVVVLSSPLARSCSKRGAVKKTGKLKEKETTMRSTIMHNVT